ncbi:hypothetical protein ATP_00407 [Candidatus Phytoplasma mali]|uniref:Uncharacterized protein n=1 Tax=Phytoplasma mali (strain AT) TaxID=482235 RepID=B3QZI7_PHYMT|nr:hypothetical protein [Candidatus Phytoplasma mali]CAP18594.1 hypothetical protein ATP_00407 [Candidatus Phytoplasma mali]
MQIEELLKNEVFTKKMKRYIEFESTLDSLNGGGRGFTSLCETLYETKMHISDTFYEFINNLDETLQEFKKIIKVKKVFLKELIKEEYKLDDEYFRDLYNKIL